VTRGRLFVAVGLLTAFLLAGFVSGYASTAPDGLTKVAQEQGFAGRERAHAFADFPLAGYAVRGVADQRLAGGLAGVIGVAVTFLVGGAAFAAIARLGRRRPAGGRRGAPAGKPAPAVPPAR
jgi:cobalt/nickel transport protein